MQSNNIGTRLVSKEKYWEQSGAKSIRKMELILKLNSRLQPIHRQDIETTLLQILMLEKIGQVSGGGTYQNQETGEIMACEIDLLLNGDKPEVIDRMVEIINRIGVPKGSVLFCPSLEKNVKVGTLEGMAFYCNGTELPQEVYANSDINHVIQQMGAAMEGIGRFFSYWEGNEWTALYFYGTSFEEMKKAVKPFVESYPLCQKSRVERIA